MKISILLCASTALLTLAACDEAASKATQVYDTATPEALNPNPKDFRFENYTKLGKKALGNALACMFPISTDKKFVDSILIDVAGARHEQETLPAPNDPKKNVADKYFYPMPWGLTPNAKEEQKVVLYFNNGKSIEEVSLSGISSIKCLKGK